MHDDEPCQQCGGTRGAQYWCHCCQTGPFCRNCVNMYDGEPLCDDCVNFDEDGAFNAFID